MALKRRREMPELLNEKTREKIFNEICSEVFPKEFYEYLLKEQLKEILERTKKPFISSGKTNGV